MIFTALQLSVMKVKLGKSLCNMNCDVNNPVTLLCYIGVSNLFHLLNYYLWPHACMEILVALSFMKKI